MVQSFDFIQKIHNNQKHTKDNFFFKLKIIFLGKIVTIFVCYDDFLYFVFKVDFRGLTLQYGLPLHHVLPVHTDTEELH